MRTHELRTHRITTEKLRAHSPGAPVTVESPTTFEDVVVFESTSTTTSGVGAINGATVSAVEYGPSAIHQTVLAFTATGITMRDTEQGGGVKVYDFPEGRILVLGTTATIGVTTTSALAGTLNAGVTCNWGLGTTTQANATLATTEQNLLPVTAFTSSATIDVAGADASGALAASAHFDGTTAAVDVYLNLAVAGATDIDADATVTVTGDATITWINLGDY